MRCPKCHKETIKFKGRQYCETCQGFPEKATCVACNKPFWQLLGIKYAWVWHKHECPPEHYAGMEGAAATAAAYEEGDISREPLFGQKLEDGFSMLHGDLE